LQYVENTAKYAGRLIEDAVGSQHMIHQPVALPHLEKMQEQLMAMLTSQSRLQSQSRCLHMQV
jgi:hypothetical protein